MQKRLAVVALQLSLGWILVIAVWQLLGPEPQNSYEQQLRIITTGLAICLSVGLWIITSRLTAIFKLATFVICPLVVLAFGIHSTRKFNASCRVLEAAHLVDGRVVHEGIGLSYAVSPDWKVDLQPSIKKDTNRSARNAGTLPSRLGLGEVAVFRHLLRPRSREYSDRTQAMIVIEIHNNPCEDLDHLIRYVRSNEDKLAKSPDVRIVRNTHHLQRAGLEMVEYELITKPRGLMARTVYLRMGIFVLNFMLLTDLETDRAQFDELLNSIRLGT